MRAGAIAPFLALAVNALPQGDDTFSLDDSETGFPFSFPTPILRPVTEPFGGYSEDSSLSTTTCCETTIVTLSTTTIINSVTSTYSGTVGVYTYTSLIY